MLYAISKYIFRWMCRLLFRIEAHRVDAIPRAGGFLLVSNHASNLDPLLVGVLCPRRLDFLAKAELFQVPLLKNWMHGVGAYPIHRDKVDRKALSLCVQRVREGAMLVIFPEGTRTDDGGLQPGKPGVAMVAAQTGVPCVPAYVDGSFEAWPRHRRFFRPVKIHVWYGAPFDLPARAEGMGAKDHYQICVDEMMRRIALLREEALAFRKERRPELSHTG